MLTEQGHLQIAGPHLVIVPLLVVTWRSKKQSMVARPSVEAEFRSMTDKIYKSL